MMVHITKSMIKNFLFIMLIVHNENNYVICDDCGDEIEI